ncbi:unnamed protein product [Periconia digitata]|uniref:Dynamin N-terminal domain-containing protein n=1 Tax=Periconia digitata TaxID=1303443 RepID=A0A9W4UQZ5_9PLEO|nr:unnamed protein product [Periconia digitata]
MPPANTGYLESSRSSAYPNRSHLETRFGQRLSPFSTSRADSDSEEPIPSIEKDTPAPANGQLARIESPESSRGSLESEELNHSFRNCEIGTPGGLSTPLPEYRTPTPSISVEPATLSEKSGHLYSAGSIHLPGVFGDLRIGSSPPEPSSPFAASRGRCISPSVHSRSNSNQNRPVYRVEDEEPPEAMFYTGKVQDALQTGKTIMSKMMDLLSNHDSGREAKPAVQNLFQQASELGKFELHSSRTVGLIGDIGVGKSSTINSLLDLGSLAREGSNGGACTSVATEYHYHARDDFVVEVNYFDEEELRLQYEEMLRVYRNHTFSQYQDDKITRDDDNSKEGSATIAITILKESFGEKLNSTPSILSELDFFDAINELVCWASLLLKSHSNSKRMSFVRVEDCSAKLVELTSPRSTFSQAHMSVPACPWPFIKNLKVYSKSYILSQGLILVDLPGLRDSNLARQNVTERYIRNCDHILVVADIGRAVAHQSVKEIFETAERGKLHNISVVCTKSELSNTCCFSMEFC